MTLAAGQASRRWNPLTLLPALHAGWASDPLWLNSGAAWNTGDLVSAWRNQSGAGDPASTLTTRPVYTTGVFDGKPGVLFNSALTTRLTFNITDIAQPFHILTVIQPVTVATNQVFIGRGTGGGAHGLRINSTPTWGQQWATAVAGGTPDTNPHVVRATVNGSASSLSVDGSVVTSANPGTLALGQISLGCGYDGTTFAQPFNGYMFYWGYYDATAIAAATVDNLGSLLRGFYNF